MIRRPWLAVPLSLALVGCANVTFSHPVLLQAAHDRFAVTLSPGVVSETNNNDVPIQDLTEQDLARIDSLLPGPPTTVTITVGDPDQILPAVGTVGFTDPETGAITIGLDPRWTLEPPDISFSLARTLAREVDHSVRITRGPGFERTLLDQLVVAGTQTTFDQSAFPGPPDPWVGALTASQECQQWKHLRPLLEKVGLHPEVLLGGPVNATLFGESNMPPATGRDIGYDIVAEYISRNPAINWVTLTETPAQTILNASGYSPCAATRADGPERGVPDHLKIAVD
ncbi:MAG: DUF2268 domain-containing putative Zn-dependent protease [Candidatus Dormiibacterota bacterium]